MPRSRAASTTSAVPTARRVAVPDGDHGVLCASGEAGHADDSRAFSEHPLQLGSNDRYSFRSELGVPCHADTHGQQLVSGFMFGSVATIQLRRDRSWSGSDRRFADLAPFPPRAEVADLLAALPHREHAKYPGLACPRRRCRPRRSTARRAAIMNGDARGERRSDVALQAISAGANVRPRCPFGGPARVDRGRVPAASGLSRIPERGDCCARRAGRSPRRVAEPQAPDRG